MVKVRLLAVILTLIEAVGMILSLLLICAMVVMVPGFHFPLPRIQIIKGIVTGLLFSPVGDVLFFVFLEAFRRIYIKNMMKFSE
ncbi:hypothetical protein HF670_07790 [Acidithiobacillus thiooxidans]|uniref:Uncharacterized protein n=2 Tax=Acidithiobacillus thiooxidans TaxID=930 RepID=A0A1C2I8B2_ACITH|nr:hypothetical protein [Acidithiobacillus thiooxidans]MBU2839465.1 hypothetical protein [Acidithiobacillus thiooxidans]MBU2842277.1 hypothetical protein [Acidithiobacillus thiooxidans]OCX72213.1 hypothetical protein A6P07_10520 [Acidithiobacillus thiooxidans]OCX72891.1 hypothetical protein A6M23_08890 [Acidithiobacillus thiooxidans]OCX73404.1 hypothetical protein A6O24_11565 [Acidithiobacillus thiooxidans]